MLPGQLHHPMIRWITCVVLTGKEGARAQRQLSRSCTQRVTIADYCDCRLLRLPIIAIADYCDCRLLRLPIIAIAGLVSGRVAVAHSWWQGHGRAVLDQRLIYIYIHTYIHGYTSAQDQRLCRQQSDRLAEPRAS